MEPKNPSAQPTTPDENSEHLKVLRMRRDALTSAIRDIEREYTNDDTGLKQILTYLTWEEYSDLRENPRVRAVAADLMKVILTDAVPFLASDTIVADIMHDVNQRINMYAKYSRDTLSPLLEEDWKTLAEKIAAIPEAFKAEYDSVIYPIVKERMEGNCPVDQTVLFKAAIEDAKGYAANLTLLSPEERKEVLNHAKRILIEELELLK
jgi:hypothetical protein